MERLKRVEDIVIKILELREDEKRIQNEISEKKIEHGKCVHRLDELSSVIKVTKSSKN